MTTPRDFGWWIESTDEDVYGPVTKETLAQFLRDGVVSANTSVRHCTEAVSAPIVDQGLVEGVDLSAVKRIGDTLAESWPKRKRDRLALAQSDMECAYHRRPAVLTCIRCLAPYCAKCQLQKSGKAYYMCKKCQSGKFNRRFIAFLGDSFLINTLPTYGAVAVVIAAGVTDAAASIVNVVSGVTVIFFVLRDSLMNGAGPFKRLFGLRVVKAVDGVQPVSHGQGAIRWMGHLLPIFNLVDASRAYSDPLQRRYGDSWAGTRVIDTPEKLEKLRAKIQRKLQAKGLTYSAASVMSAEDFAKIDR